jgi:hypothetical protein
MTVARLQSLPEAGANGDFLITVWVTNSRGNSVTKLQASDGTVAHGDVRRHRCENRQGPSNG